MLVIDTTRETTRLMLTDLIGYTAGLLLALCFLPQVIKTWRLKHADRRLSVELGGAGVIGVLAVALLLAFPADASAQNASQDPDDLVNYTDIPPSGVSTNSVLDQNTFAFVLRPSFGLRQFRPDRLGLRLRLGFGFSIVQFDDTNLPELDDVQAAAFIPGLELLVPLSPSSVLKPVFDLGVGTDFTENDPFLITTLGLNAEFVWLRNRWELGLEPRSEYTLTRSKGGANDDESGRIGLNADAQYPLWFRMGDYQPTIGAYGNAGWFFVPLEFTSQNRVTEEVNYQFELGVRFSFQQRPKIWFIRIPSLRIGYAFGDGLRGLRIRLGGDRAVNLYDWPLDGVEAEVEVGD